MKLTNIILEYGELKAQEDELQAELERKFSGKIDGPFYVTLGKYAGGRPDDDPLKDKGYGKLTVRVKNYDGVPDKIWNELIMFFEAKGYDVVEDSNWYDQDDDRDYFPSIKFHFDTKE